jgi:hypothetical protein
MSFWEKAKKSQYELFLASAIIIYTLTFSWFTISKHNSFTTYACARASEGWATLRGAGHYQAGGAVNA